METLAARYLQLLLSTYVRWLMVDSSGQSDDGCGCLLSDCHRQEEARPRTYGSKTYTHKTRNQGGNVSHEYMA